VRDTVFEFLSARPQGATPEEIFALVFAPSVGGDAPLASSFVASLLGEDRRFRWDESTNTWQLAPRQADLALADTTFVVLDLETTDQGGGASAIIEVGALRIRGGKVIAELEQLINPGTRLSPFVVRLTGIDDALLARQPPLAAVWPRIAEFLGDSVLVAHNGAYDFACLNAASLACDGEPLRNDQLCTFRLARQVLPDTPRRGLDSLAAHYGIPTLDRHRALGDARMTAEILLQLIEDLAKHGVSTTAQLLEMQHRAQDGKPFHCPLPSEKVAALPATAGIYRFYDETGQLLYIGRARNLRERVGSYLSNAAGHSDKTLELIRQVCDVRAESLGSELEAALDEAAAIRRERPPYNRLSKHLPRIAFVRLTLEDPFPRLSITPRLRPGRQALHIGPFQKRRDAERAVTALTRLYKLRTCPGTLQPEPTVIPCMQADLQACTAPCAEYIDAAAYRTQVSDCLAAIDGHDAESDNRLMARLRQVARELGGERGARLYADTQILRGALATGRSLSWLTRQASFVALAAADAAGTVLAYAVDQGELVARASLQDESDVEPLLARIRASRQGLGRGDGDMVDGLTILAAWLRDRRADEGYVFPLPAQDIPAELAAEMAVACAALLRR